MYCRVFQCTIKPGRRPEFTRLLHDVILPELVKQPGVVDSVQLFEDTDPSQLVSITFWRSKELAEKYAREVFPRFHAQVEPLGYNFNVSTYNVENSTMHRIAAGKAA